MFAPFVDEIGLPNIDALFEQATGVLAIYDNRRDLAENLLGVVGGGQVLAWQYQDTSWPPSWALLRQGNRLYLWIAGTVNFPQIIQNIVGVFGADNSPFGNRVHSFFKASANDLFTNILPNLPPDWMACDCFLAAHSYGAATALLLANSLRLAVPGMQVELMGFAMPKSMTLGFNGLFPQRFFCIQADGDAIPFLPPNGILSAAQGPLGIWDIGIPITWTQYGEQFTLKSGGTVTRAIPGDFDAIPGPSLIAGTPGAHVMPNYLQWILNGWKAQNGQGQDEAIVPIAVELLGIRIAQNGNVNINLANFVDVAAQNAQVFLNQDGGPLNEGNIPLVENFTGELVQVLPGNAILPALFSLQAGQMIKVLYSFTDGTKSGFSESWYLDGIPAGQSAAGMIGNYLNSRLALSGLQTVFQFARISTVPPNKNPTVIFPRQLGPNAATEGYFAPARGQPSLDSDVGSTALLCAKQTATKTARLFLRGLPDDVFQKAGEIWANALWLAKFKNYSDFLFETGYGFLGSDPTARKVSPVASVTQNLNGSIAITTTLAIFTAGAFPAGDVGAHFASRITGSIWNTNLNGPLTVICDGVSRKSVV